VIEQGKYGEARKELALALAIIGPRCALQLEAGIELDSKPAVMPAKPV